MSIRFDTAVLGLMVAAAACTYEERSVTPPGETKSVTLRLERNEDSGTLEACDASGQCSSHSNPDQCVVLEVTIDLGTGRTCERCLDDAGNVLREGCGDASSVACTLVIAPDPDCVVCAYIDGSVIYSTCVASEPDCQTKTFATSSGTATCSTCYDQSGRVALDECQQECASIACPAVSCAPGYQPERMPGECCERCVAETSCNETVCPMDTTPPTCPEGSTLVRDPADCCHYYCRADQCAAGTTDTVSECPAGYVWDTSYPNCGRCVPEEEPARYCTSDADCGTDEYCTTGSGECLPPPECTPESPCQGVCYGTCRSPGGDCPSYQVPYCEGEYVDGGVDENGCPLPPQCMCPDGVTSTDGTCSDQCANVYCFDAPPECEPGQTLVTDYPYCCGACLDEESCDSSSCAQVTCPAGYHEEPGADCCPTCVRDEQPCSSRVDCAEGQFCTTEVGTCEPPPAGTNSTSDCWGSCMTSMCHDSDGFDPYLAGAVETFDAAGPSRYADACADSGAVWEYSCYAPYSGAPDRYQQKTYVSCQNGCREGACTEL